LSFLRGSPFGGRAASVLSPAAHRNYFHLSFGGGIRSWLSFRWSGLGSSVLGAWPNWGGRANGRRRPEEASDWLLGGNP
jgi:hypothetical protein